MNLRIPVAHDDRRSSARRQVRAVEIGRSRCLEPEARKVDEVERLETGRIAGQHRPALHGEHLGTRVAGHHVGTAAAVGIGRPRGDFRIVGESRGHEVVGVPTPDDRIARL